MSDFDEGAFGSLSHGSTPRRAHPTGGTSTSTTTTPSPRRESGARVERRTIAMDHDDEYSGEVVMQGGVAVPHGQGTLLSRSGRHCYVGDFSHRWRDGYGKLVTERYVLWSRWRMNRPDLSNSCRVDYANGDKYCGFLSLQTTDAHPTKGPRLGGGGPVASEAMSKFSLWVQSTVPVRCRWGELVTAGGHRYFGEWEEGRPHGFGCYAAPSGDRYVGRFRHGMFHDTGTLFSRRYAQDGVSRLPDGDFLSATDAAAATSSPPLPAASQDMCVFDGVWADGKFVGEGHVTLPGGTRVSADWRGASQPVDGEVVFAAAAGHRAGGGSGRWHEYFHWEPLLCGAVAEQRSREQEASKGLRERLSHLVGSGAGGGSAGALRVLLLEFLDAGNQLRAAVRIFRRCFYFFYGSCGRSGCIGEGQGGNALGWCYQRNPFGGCIHPGRGRAIAEFDLSGALVDIFSFSRSVLRWTADMLGDDNLQQLDMLGVPVDLTVGRWVADAVLADTHHVLLNLYQHVYAAEAAEVGKAQVRLRGRVTLDDMGVEFARHHSEERLFDPYADAVHCIEQLGTPGCVTLTAKLAVLTQWSRDIDLSTRLAQASAGGAAAAATRKAPSGAHSVPTTTAAGTAPSGSADDLLPIHQYVLSQARLRHLHAHTRLLADFAEEPSFVDATAQESFCVTNFVACTLTLPQLQQGLWDSDGVLTPASLFTDRLREVLARIPQAAAAASKEAELETTDLACVALGYLAAWLPETLTRLAAAPRPLPAVLPLSTNGPAWLPPEVGRTASLEALGSASGASAVRHFCWRVAGSVLSSGGIICGPLPSTGCDGATQQRDAVTACTLDSTGSVAECGADSWELALSLPPDVLPSFFLLLRDTLLAHL